MKRFLATLSGGHHHIVGHHRGVAVCRPPSVPACRGGVAVCRPPSVPACHRGIALSANRMQYLEENPFYARYAKKLAEKHETSPEEFLQKLTELKDKKEKLAQDAKEAAEEERNSAAEAASQSKPKKLNDVMKLDLIKDKTADEIERLWSEHHKKKDVIFSVIPANQYKELHRRSKEFPNFVYPLPREMGYEFFAQQFSGHNIHFTSLIAYQTHKENAPCCLTVTHYTELMEDKGIVLMVGEPDTNTLSVHEAQLLALQVKMYYGVHSGLKFNLVRLMNNSPSQFKHMDLVKEFENYKRDFKEAKQ